MKTSNKRTTRRLRIESLEDRLVPAPWGTPLGVGFTEPIPSEPGTYGQPGFEQPPAEVEGGEDLKTTPPVQVSGPYLTLPFGDELPVAFNDPQQGNLDTCVIVASTSAMVGASPDTILIDIPDNRPRGPLGNPEPGIYKVRLFRPNAQSGLLEPTWVDVPFDGSVNSQDMRPADEGEFWPVLVQRAYLSLSQEVGFNYRSLARAYESLVGQTPESFDPAVGSRPDAQRILNALNAGQPVTAATVGTVDEPLTVLNPQYGIVGAHAYTVLGIELPPTGTDGIWVTLRNPWASDNHWSVYDVDGSGVLDLAEWFAFKAGLDGVNDGIIRVPWSVFAEHFKTAVIGPALAGGSINLPQQPNGQVYFLNPNPGPFEIREGETLSISLPAVDPEGGNPFYSVLEGPGYVQVQSGNYTWLPGPDDLGVFSVTIGAETTSFDANSVTFIVKVNSGRPRIHSLSASTNSVTDAGTDPIVLTANGVIHDFDDVDFVEFYRDANGNNTLEPESDFLLKGDGTISDGWSWSGQLTGVTPGNYSVFARAARYSFSDLFYSNVVSNVIQVTAAPPPEVVAVPVGPETVAVSNAAGVYPVAVTKDAAGNSAVFVNLPDGAYVRRFNASAQVIDTVKILERGIHHAAMQPDGKYTVVWQEGGHVYARRHFPDGTTASGVIQVTDTIDDFYDGSRDSPRVAIAADGGFLVTWTSGGFTIEDLSYRRYSPNNTPLSSPVRYSGGDSGEQSPSIALDTTGNAVIAWYTRNGDRVMAATINQSGVITSYIGVSPQGEFVNYDGVQVAYTQDGGFVVVWAGENVVFRRFAADRTPLDAAPVRLSPVDGGTAPNLVATPSGHFVVVWNHMARDAGDGEFDLGVYGQVVDPNGNLMGDNFRVPTTIGFSQFTGGLAADGGLDFIATWGQVTDRFFDPSTEVRFQRFTVDLPPTVSTLPVVSVGRQAKRTVSVPAVDPDGSPVSVTAINGVAISAGGSVNLPSGARVTLNANATLAYEPRNAVAVGSVDSFAYTVSDGTKTSVGSMSYRIANDLDAKPVKALDGNPAVRFSELPANHATATQVTVKGLGTDGILATDDDTLPSFTTAWQDTTLVLSGLPAGLFRVTVDDALADETGRLLDGNGDGVAGGDFVRDFLVNSPGAGPDPSFGTGGRVAADLGYYESQGRAVLVQPDGKIVVGGYSNDSGTYFDFALARFLPDGTPDATFGTGGFVKTAFTGTTSLDVIRGLALQPDGKIVAVGESAIDEFNNFNDHAFAVARYLPDGTLDSSFDGDGRATIDFGAYEDRADGVVVLADGRIVVGGRTGLNGYNGDFALVRLLSDGSPDPTFGTAGRVVTPANVSGNFNQGSGALLRLASGRLLAAHVNNNLVTVARYLPNGDLDATFGTAGVARTTLPNNFSARGLSIQPDGQLLVSGTDYRNSVDFTAVARVLPGGGLDGSFGNNGIAIAAVSGLSNASAYSATMLADGSVIAAGSHNSPTNYGTALFKFRADGTPDGEFGPNGIVELGDLYGGSPFAVTVGLDGRIIAVGETRPSSQQELAVWRATPGATVPLTGAGGFAFEVDVAGFGSGQLLGPGLDAMNVLRVGGTDFAAPPSANGADDGGRTLTTGMQSIATLGVRREVTVPTGDGVSFARTIDSFANTSGEPVSTTIRYVSNLGSDAATTVFATSDGDLVVETTDWWIATDDGNGTGSPAIVHVLGGPRGLKPTSVQINGDSLVWSYDLTVEDGETIQLATFAIPATLRSQALASLNSVITSTGLVGLGDEYLTQPEIDSLANIGFLQAPTTVGTINDTAGDEDGTLPVIPLRPNFADAEDGAAGLTYTVVSITGNSNLVSTSVDPNTDELTLTPNLNANGTATITIRATDSDGLFVESSLDVTLDPMPDAPIVDAGQVLMLPSVAKNAANPPGVSVATLLRTSSNPDGSNTGYGIAVTGLGGIAGQWEYSTTVGGLWSQITGVSDGLALLLPRTAIVRFVPNRTLTGHAGLQFRAWDGVTGTPGNSVSVFANPMAFSSNEVGWVPVGIKSPTFDTFGRAITKSLKEDTNGPFTIAKTLLGLLTSEFPAGTKLGLAITGTTGDGDWQVLVGKTWQAIVDPSETAARLISPTSKLRFVPDLDFTGDATITYRAWKLPTTGPLPLVGDIIADPASYSVERQTAVATVTPINDAPTVSLSLARVFDAAPQGVVKLLEGSSDVDGFAAGIAITKVVGKNGRWEYRLSSSDSWAAIPKVSTGNALLLGLTAQIQFVPNNGATVANGTLNYKVFDDSIPFVNGDRQRSTTPAFSTAIETATFSLGNTAPTFKPGDAPVLPKTSVGKKLTFPVSRLVGRMQDSKGFQKGIAITSVGGNGSWEFTIDGGKTWQAVGTLGTNRLLLRSTDRLRFTPTAAGTATLSFAAWDRTTGGAGDLINGADDSQSVETLTATLSVA